jgi:hypothetical protein
MDPHIILEENKLLLTSEALTLLNAQPGNRIAVNYVQVSSEYTFPVIAKAEYFIDPEAGNKLTKSNTVSFRGIQNKTLNLYGVNFVLEFYKEGIYKMVSI